MVAAKDIQKSEQKASAPDANEAPDPGDAALPEGMDEYVRLFRAAQNGAESLSAARLRSDMGAHVFDAPAASPLRSFTTFISLEGREIGVRVYHPGTDIRRPGVCYFHGGGFAFGSLDTFDSLAAGLAEETGAVVASVEYRRLPESRYDDAQDDCHQALRWLRRHAEDLNIEPSRIGVAGDSVGALLATTAAMQARDAGDPALAFQLLLYGAFALQPGRPAYARSRDPLLTGDKVESFIRLYWSARVEACPFQPPLAVSDLGGLPPAVILTADRDPLREEALEYAARLKEAGVAITARTAPGMIHGFLRARGICPAAARELKTLAASANPYLWPDEASQPKE